MAARRDKGLSESLILDKIAIRQSQRQVTLATTGSRCGNRPRKDMAVESTPERSFSLLFSSSRRPRRSPDGSRPPEMRRRHHRPERRLDRLLPVGQEGRRRRPASCPAPHKATCGIAPTSRAWLVFSQWFRRSSAPFGVDKDVGNVLDVADLPLIPTDLRAAGWRQPTALVGSNSSAAVPRRPEARGHPSFRP